MDRINRIVQDLQDKPPMPLRGRRVTIHHLVNYKNPVNPEKSC